MARVAGLPERIDPWYLVEREGCLCGHLSLARMERLAASLCDDGEGTVFIDARFQRDEKGRELAVGHVTARLPVRRQLRGIVAYSEAHRLRGPGGRRSAIRTLAPEAELRGGHWNF